MQTDRNGCYAVADVPAGTYFVFARLEGFVSVTYDNLIVAPGSSQHVDFVMRIGGMCECLKFPETLSELWDKADAVVHVRITGHDPDSPEIKDRGATLTVWKRPANLAVTNPLTFRRFTENNEVEPYAVGQEFVLFLEWVPVKQAFVRMSSGYGPIGAFAIEGGQIHSGLTGAYAGRDANELFSELASFVNR